MIRSESRDANYGGPDSAKSGTISASQESWLQTTVYGEGTVTFYVKKAAGTNDNFSFKVDGSTYLYIDGISYAWTKKTYPITGLGPHTLQWRYSKYAGGTPSDGGAWIDRVGWTSASQNSTPLQLALDAGWAVTTTGDEDWSSTTSGAYYGGDCAKSGYISDGETSEMAATVEGSGTVTFYWKVSSEEDYDELKFYLDGVFKAEISGEVGWQQKSYAVGSGTHSLVWKYVKDSSEYSGSDCGWVDYIQGPGTTPPEPPDLLAQALDCSTAVTTGGSANWNGQTFTDYYDNDAAESGSISDSQETWMQTTVTASAGDKATFYWKVSSGSGDYLKFYIDGQYQTQITGEVA